MSQPFIGQVTLFCGNFAPAGWAFCSGQLLPISQNSALFSLIGTTYGGDGVSTFGLPDLQGRVPIGQGTGPGLTDRIMGQGFGTEQVTIDSTTLPAHSHALNAATSAATSNTVAASVLPGSVAAPGHFYASNTGTPGPTFGNMAAGTVGLSANGGLGHENMMPSLCLSYIIAVVGIYPSQN